MVRLVCHFVGFIRYLSEKLQSKPYYVLIVGIQGTLYRTQHQAHLDELALFECLDEKLYQFGKVVFR